MQTKPASATRVESPALAAAQLPQTLLECHAVITQLLERVKLLEERINLDSNNSSKPPSSNLKFRAFVVITMDVSPCRHLVCAGFDR